MNGRLRNPETSLRGDSCSVSGLHLRVRTGRVGGSNILDLNKSILNESKSIREYPLSFT